MFVLKVIFQELPSTLIYWQGFQCKVLKQGK